jgi:multimeric flavodoxin WrbA
MAKKQNNLYKKMIEANIIVFALLVYFYTFNGLMKLLIDRIFAIEKTDALEKAYNMAKEIKINE